MINYDNIAASIEYYQTIGYERIEAPWWVSEDIMKMTAPTDHEKDYLLNTNKKVLVASGEQSFLYMATKGRLPNGSYQTVTPCFRNESIGRLHRKCFIKNELIIVGEDLKYKLKKITNDCFKFFHQVVPKEFHDQLNVIKLLENQYDIFLGDVEIGSYCHRKNEVLEWICATGCAEPRLTMAIKTAKYKAEND